MANTTSSTDSRVYSGSELANSGPRAISDNTSDLWKMTLPSVDRCRGFLEIVLEPVSWRNCQKSEAPLESGVTEDQTRHRKFWRREEPGKDLRVGQFDMLTRPVFKRHGSAAHLPFPNQGQPSDSSATYISTRAKHRRCIGGTELSTG
jgi:hypothetical protein